MPRDLAMRLLFEDCDRMLADMEHRKTIRIVAMLEWLQDVYCKGMSVLRAAEIRDWALEYSALGGVECVWLQIKASPIPQK